MEPVDLVGHAQQVAATAETMHAAGAAPIRIAHAIAGLTDQLTSKLLVLAEEELGTPPCAYAWLALGSEGRMEQVLVTDQDNALAYADDNVRARSYFPAMAEQVVAGLLRAGIPACPGGYMATNWCRSLTDWKGTFQAWIAEPTPQALVEAEVFLDFRPVSGDLPIAELDQAMLAGGGRGLFLFHLAQVARRFPPPLGSFGRIRATDGAVDLKRGGLGAIVLLARLYALAAQSTARSTLERLAAATDAGVLSRWGGEALTDIYEFLMRLRLDRQLRHLAEGKVPDNTVVLNDLTVLERRRLRDAFRTVRKMQDATALRFGPGL